MTEGSTRPERGPSPEQQRNKTIKRIVALLSVASLVGAAFFSEGRPSSPAPERNADPSGEMNPPEPASEPASEQKTQDETQRLAEQLHEASLDELYSIEEGLGVLKEVTERSGQNVSS